MIAPANSAVLATLSAKCNVVGVDSLPVITAGGCIGIAAPEPNVISFLPLDRFSVDGQLANPRRYRLSNLELLSSGWVVGVSSITADIFVLKEIQIRL